MQRRPLRLDETTFFGFDRYQNRQLGAAVVVVLTIAAGGITLIALNKSVAGLILLVSELAVLAGVFLAHEVSGRGSVADSERQGDEGEGLREES